VFGKGLKKGRAGLSPLQLQHKPEQDLSSLQVQGTAIPRPMLPELESRPQSPVSQHMPDLAAQVHAERENQAAITIQKAARGMLARNELSKLRQEKAKQQKLKEELTALGGGRLFAGMSTANAEKIMGSGFEHRDTNDPLSVDKDSRNGRGVYLSESSRTAANFAAQNSPTGNGRVIQFDEVDLRGLSSIRHNAKTGAHDVVNAETEYSGSRKFKSPALSTANPESRLMARKSIVASTFGGDAAKLDYVTGKTQNMGTEETVLFSKEAVDRVNTSKKTFKS
jgi:hypothetical protein